MARPGKIPKTRKPVLSKTQCVGCQELKEKLRRAVADYMCSEGCSCCQHRDHDKHAEVIAELLEVEMWDDGSGYNFYKYRSKD